ncbi:hypothetical protein [Streptomyces sp. 2P-4]|uniref:hypothetical protein n=1 Tax=Streptomyces sp. 2P-4 TaxID=2931974 RepID=UPI002540463B|nr:hypothetical protein [Streptomyces sp. 2P-4]
MASKTRPLTVPAEAMNRAVADISSPARMTVPVTVSADGSAVAPVRTNWRSGRCSKVVDSSCQASLLVSSSKRPDASVGKSAQRLDRQCHGKQPPQVNVRSGYNR